MVNGQIRLSGSGQTLLNDPEVRKAYLGISGGGGYSRRSLRVLMCCQKRSAAWLSREPER